MRWRVLVVEDEQAVAEGIIENLSESIARFAGEDPAIIHVSAFEEALPLLEYDGFDVLVLDVRDNRKVDNNASETADTGLSVFSDVRARLFVPIVFYTALPDLVEGCGSAPFVQVVEKSSDSAALEEAVEVALTSTFHQVRAALDKHVEAVKRDFMIDFVEKHWPALQDDTRRSDVAHLLLRRLALSLDSDVTVFADALGHEVVEVATALVHPMRFYIVPPPPDRLTGDVMCTTEEDADGNEVTKWFLVLNPSCDLVVRGDGDASRMKADNVVFVECTPMKDTAEYKSWSDRKPGVAAPTKSSTDRLAALMKNNRGTFEGVKHQAERYHYLPSAWDLPDLVVDFQLWDHVSTESLESFQRVATLDSPYAESISNRFNRYYSRVGTPDLDVSCAINRLND